MNFEQFTRSILLAQGSFAAFLQANPDERAPILERITGTEIYSQISLAVHERKKEEQLKLEALQEQFNNISVLSEEEETDLEKLFKDKDLEQKTLAGEHENLVTKLNELKQIKSLILEKTKIDENLLNSDKKIFQSEEDLKIAIQEKDRIEKDIESFHFMKKSHQELFIKVRDLDFKIEESNRNLSKSTQELKSLKLDSEKLNEENIKLESDRQNALKKAEEYETLFQESLDIEFLSKELPLLKNILDNYHRVEKTIYDSESKLENLNKQLISARKDFSASELNLKTFETKKTNILTEIQNSEMDLKKLLGDLDLSQLRAKFESVSTLYEIKSIEKNKFNSIQSLDLLTKDLKSSLEKKTLLEELCEQLEKNKIQELKIKSLEEERKILKQGEACPLCGSLEHPFINNDIKFESFESELDKKRNELSEHREKHSKLLVEISSLEKEIELFNNNVDDLQNKVSQIFWEAIKDLSLAELNSLNLDLKAKIERIEQLDKNILINNKALRDFEADCSRLIIERDSVKEKGMKLKSEFDLFSEQIKGNKLEVQNIFTELKEKFSLLKFELFFESDIDKEYMKLDKEFELLKTKKKN